MRPFSISSLSQYGVWGHNIACSHLGGVLQSLSRSAHLPHTHSYIDSIVFTSLDLSAVVIQAVSCGKASIAAKDANDPKLGDKMTIFGVIVQMIGIALVRPLVLNNSNLTTHILFQFCILGADFVFRFYRNKPLRSVASSPKFNSDPTSHKFTSSKQDFRAFPTNVHLMLLGAGMTTFWVLIRLIYRTFEFANGWMGRITATRAYFYVIDGAPIVLAMFTLNLFHPGWLLREGTHSISETSSFGGEDYGFDNVGPKGDRILPLRLELGWSLNADDLWKLVTSIKQ